MSEPGSDLQGFAVKRIFQHFEGDIEELVGAHFSAAKAVVDNDSGELIVLWLYEDSRASWYRIFLDGIYCGIDKFSYDGSADDADDHLTIKDLSHIFYDETVEKASVTSGSAANTYLTLSINFKSFMCNLVYRYPEEICTLVFTKNSQAN